MKTPDLYIDDRRSARGWQKVRWLWFWWTWRLVRDLYWLTHLHYHRPWRSRIWQLGGWWNGGRHTDGDPDLCRECGHVFRTRDAIHTYQDDGTGEPEPVDECRKCGAEV